MSSLTSTGLLLVVVVCCVASPRWQRSSHEGFIGEGTNELATALTQGFVDLDSNLVFSPLAYSTILAIVAEGARGPTRDEIATALHFPDNIQLVRKCYKHALDNLKGGYDGNNPDFKNWFYVYKNYTVEPEYKEVLTEFYNTEVKSVDRPDDYVYQSEKKKPISIEIKPESEKPSITKPFKETETDEQVVASLVDKNPTPHEVDAEEAVSNNAQTFLDKPEKENSEKNDEPILTKSGISNLSEKVQIQVVHTEPVDTSVVQKIPIKGATVVKEKPKVEDGVKKVEPVVLLEEVVSGKKVEKEDTEVSKEMMVAMQRGFRTSGGESFEGMTDGALKTDKNATKSQMIIFNGLYFKGKWDFPFVKKSADENRAFYKSDTEKVVASTMMAEGTFNSGRISSLDSTVVELPYKGGRYSLLILLPDSQTGLNKLIADMSGFSLKNVFLEMTRKAVAVCIPIFEVTTISKPISSFSKLGISQVSKVFNQSEADLSGISKEPGLFLEELVQFVTFEVDQSDAEANLLTATNAATRSEFEKIAVNHPFLFYVYDKIDNIIIVSGKVVDPTIRDDGDDSWMKRKL